MLNILALHLNQIINYQWHYIFIHNRQGAQFFMWIQFNEQHFWVQIGFILPSLKFVTWKIAETNCVQLCNQHRPKHWPPKIYKMTFLWNANTWMLNKILQDFVHWGTSDYGRFVVNVKDLDVPCNVRWCLSLSILRKWDWKKVIKGAEKGSVINFIRLIDGWLAQDLLRVRQGLKSVNLA